MVLAATATRKLVALERKLANHPDQFVLMRILGIVFGIRYECSGGWSLRRLLWYCYQCVLLLSFSTCCHKTYWAVTQWEYGSSLSNVVGSMWVAIAAIMRVHIFDRPELGRLQRFLNDRTFRGSEPSVRDARWRLRRTNNRYMVVVVASLLLEIVSFLATNFHVQTEFLLLYRGQLVGGTCVQIVYICIVCLWSVMYVVVFSFVYTMLNAFRLEMAILVQSFTDLSECFLRYQPDLADVAQEAAFWEELQDQLRERIVRHVDLLENLYSFFTIVVPFSFVQYYGTFVLLATCSAIVAFQGLTPSSVTYFAFIGFLVLESFVLYRSIALLNELHLSIGSTLYDLDWHGRLRFSKRFASSYRHVRQSLLIVMIRAQTPFRLAINGHGTFSMNRFAELMNSSYSMFTLLLQLRSRMGTK